MSKNFSSSLKKDIFRTIKHSLSRFLAIISMTGLNAIVFIGLITGVPNLRHMITSRVNDHNIYDIKISQAAGLRAEDEKIIDGIKDLKDVEYVRTDTFNIKDKELTVKIFTKTDKIDTYIVTKGNLPQNTNEILLDQKYYEDFGDQLGQYIEFENKNDLNDDPLLDNTRFKIVGFGTSVDYIANQRSSGQSSEGNYFAVVTPSNLLKEFPDYALLKLGRNQGYDISTEEFKKFETSSINQIKLLFKDRPQDLETYLIEDAKSQIADAEQEIQDGLDELDQARLDLEDAKKELDDAKDKIADGQIEYQDGLDSFEREISKAQREIEDGQRELNKAKRQLADGRKEYEAGLETFNKEIAKSQKELNLAKAKLDDAKEELDSGLAQYEEGIKKYEAGLKEFEAGKAQIEENKDLIRAGLEQVKTQKDQLEAQKSELEIQKNALLEQKAQLEAQIIQIQQALILDPENPELLANLEALKAGLAQINTGLEQVGDGLSQIDAGLTSILTEEEKLLAGQKELEAKELELKAAEQELANSKEILDQSKIDFDEGKAQYEAGLKEYQDGLATLNRERQSGQEKLRASKAKLDDGQREIDANQAKLDDAKTTLAEERQKGLGELNQAQADLEEAREKYNDGLDEYQDGLEEFKEEEQKAKDEIADAREEIEDARDDLDSIKVPLYSVKGKYDNVAFFSYIDQANSLNKLAYIFTFMFYLVAILVTLTTILRMVETERMQIGTLKALGYSRRTILAKFLVYGLSATIIGVVLGIIIGYYFFMPPVINAYTSATNMTENPMIFEFDKAVLIFIVSLGIIAATVYFAVGRNLRENAASLMRPKPPKKSKRTLLERIPYIWNRLSFLNKVSFRNVIRSKVRLFMTILGVSGSFSLIAMAFGLQHSIETVGDKQFGHVYKFDAQIIYNKDADDYLDMVDALEKNSKDYTSLIYLQVQAKNPSGFNEDLNIVATKDLADLNKFIGLQERKSQTPLSLEDNKVVVSEKLAKSMSVAIGDNLNFRDANGVEQSLEINGITEQYFSHQVYMTYNTYRSFDSTQKENSFLIKYIDDMADPGKLEKTLNQYDATLAFIYSSDLAETLDSLGESLDIIIVLIIAISALLTFVVLYNLTNINISERIREISTIKVLGFRPGEVVSYIFKENYILTLIGMLAGIGLAKLMHYIIVYSLSPGAFLFDPYMIPTSSIYAALIVAAFTILVMLASKRELNKIDMVEALKAVD